MMQSYRNITGSDKYRRIILFSIAPNALKNSFEERKTYGPWLGAFTVNILELENRKVGT